MDFNKIIAKISIINIYFICKKFIRQMRLSSFCILINISFLLIILGRVRPRPKRERVPPGWNSLRQAGGVHVVNEFHMGLQNQGVHLKTRCITPIRL